MTLRLFLARLAAGLILWAAAWVLVAACPPPAGAKGPPPEPGPGPPAYARIYEQALALRRAGDWQGALKALSRAYAAEVPVQAFYDTLDRTKLEILAALPGRARLAAGERGFTLRELNLYFQESLLTRPDTLRHDPPLDTELPPARLIYLYAVLGQARRASSGDGRVSAAAPGVDLARALAEADPWLISGALFLARKGVGHLSPAEVARRWRDRPDLWDKVCTEQALLYLARLTPAELGALTLGNGEAAERVSELRPLKPEAPPRLRVLIFRPDGPAPGAADYPRPARCAELIFRRSGCPPEPATAADCDGGAIALPPGGYLVSHAKGRETGRGGQVVLAPGTRVRLVMVARFTAHGPGPVPDN